MRQNLQQKEDQLESLVKEIERVSSLLSEAGILSSPTLPTLGNNSRTPSHALLQKGRERSDEDSMTETFLASKGRKRDGGDDDWEVGAASAADWTTDQTDRRRTPSSSSSALHQLRHRAEKERQETESDNLTTSRRKAGARATIGTRSEVTSVALRLLVRDMERLQAYLMQVEAGRMRLHQLEQEMGSCVCDQEDKSRKGAEDYDDDDEREAVVHPLPNRPEDRLDDDDHGEEVGDDDDVCSEDGDPVDGSDECSADDAAGEEGDDDESEDHDNNDDRVEDRKQKVSPHEKHEKSAPFPHMHQPTVSCDLPSCESVVLLFPLDDEWMERNGEEMPESSDDFGVCYETARQQQQQKQGSFSEE